MRDIKFRFWNNSIGKMFSVAELDLGNDWIISTDETNMYFAQGTLMQYTGLKDKNGQEIYEGDIIKDPEDAIGIVKWVNARWHIDYSKSKNVGRFDWQFGVPRSLEVVGNIYENPELLEPQK